MAENTFTNPFNVATSEDYAEKLRELDAKINQVKKNITYLDVYNIVDTVEDKDTFNSKAEALAPNSSLVINQSFNIGGESYVIGDIVLKIASGKIIHIKGQPGGVFYPSKILKDNNNNYNIKYTYSEKNPTEAESTVSINNTVNTANIANKITFTDLEPSASSNIYGLWHTIRNIAGNRNIRPYIKFYLANVANDDETKKPTEFEEIILDYKLSFHVGQGDLGAWEITGIDDNIKNFLWIKVK